MLKYKYCPQCKNLLVRQENNYYCTNCDVKIYIDPKPTTCVFLIKNGMVLLAKRAVEPYKGSFDLIGGFLEPGELPEKAVIRETKEETGLDIKILGLLSMHTDRYGKGGDYLINIYYLGEIADAKPIAHDDVASLHWFPIDKIPKMSFKSASLAIKDLQKWYKEKVKPI